MSLDPNRRFNRLNKTLAIIVILKQLFTFFWIHVLISNAEYQAYIESLSISTMPGISNHPYIPPGIPEAYLIAYITTTFTLLCSFTLFEKDNYKGLIIFTILFGLETMFHAYLWIRGFLPLLLAPIVIVIIIFSFSSYKKKAI